MKNGCCWAAAESRYCSAPSAAPVAFGGHEAPVVVRRAATRLRTLPGWRRRPAGPSGRSRTFRCRRAPLLPSPPASSSATCPCRSTLYPAAFITVARFGITEGSGSSTCGYFVVGHFFLERVLDAVLGREVAGHHRRPRGRAHAGAGEGAFEADPVAAQPAHPGQVPAQPVLREVLDRPLLIADEEDDVHPLDGAPAPRSGKRPLDARPPGQQRRRRGGRPRPDQLFASEAATRLGA